MLLYRNTSKGWNRELLYYYYYFQWHSKLQSLNLKMFHYKKLITMKKTINRQRPLKTMALSSFAALLLLLFLTAPAIAQTFTMGKKCKEANTAGIALLKEKKYQK